MDVRHTSLAVILVAHALLAGAAAHPAIAGGSPKTIRAARTAVPPRIDGSVNEPAWELAVAVDDFTQFDPKEGDPATEKTTVRLLYDDQALYVGVICYDTRPARVVSQLSRRDRITEADRFTVLIDSYHDKQSAFVFAANVAGVQSDGRYSRGGGIFDYDDTWDGVWSVETRRGSYGWSAEFTIPYDALRFAVKEDSVVTWGINFRRYISRKKESDEWVMVPRTEMFPIPLWGVVEGIRDIKPPLHLELLPYVSGSVTSHTGEVTTGTPPGREAHAGLDAKYGMARNLTLDLSVNPDFGQVEIDQAVLNLTVFETLFPEKRPFFLEGAPMFTFGSSVDQAPLMLFFSRRIGKQPTGAPFLVAPERGTIEENPQVTTILGAAKLTGRTAGGLSMAALSALTDEEHARVQDEAGNSTSVLTEPRGTYNAVRIKQDFRGTSWVGGIATLVSRDGVLPAITGGVDWNLRVAEDQYTLDGYLAAARAPDGDTYAEGAAGKLLFGRIAADHWFPLLAYEFFTPRFSINDMGFFAQPHDHGGYFQLRYLENQVHGPLRRFVLALNPEYRWNWDGLLTRALVRSEASLEFTNFWNGYCSYVHAFPAYDDEEQGIIGTYLRPSSDGLALMLHTDERFPIVAKIHGGLEWDAKAKQTVWGSLALAIRPFTWMELTPSVLYQNTIDEETWVYGVPPVVDPTVSPSPFTVFGVRDVEYLDLSFRGIVTFTRTLSLQFFVQGFVARGRYDEFKRLNDNSSLIPYDYGANPEYMNPDFNSVTLNANVLLRWEYLPGSTVFLVWTQGRSDVANQFDRPPGQRLNDATTFPREDVILLKVNYRIAL